MKILVTGAKGFVGKNLVEALRSIRDGKDKSYMICDNPSEIEIYEYDIDSTREELEEYCQKADFVFNMAGVNRPQNTEEFMQGNFGFASELLDTLKKYNNSAPVMLSSSIQASLEGRYANSEYGKSKLAGENLFKEYSKETGSKVLIYRFPNLFGKWCRPNYNSAVATFCNNIAKDLEITVNDRSVELELLYIDDLVEEMLGALIGKENRKADDYCYAEPTHKVTLGEIVDLLYSFKESTDNKYIPDMPDGSFSKKLYSTYLSYLPIDGFSYPLEMHCDERGSFTEMFKSINNGQVSVNVSKPGIVKGNHWHNTKNEKFVVVYGKGVIRFRKIGETDVKEYYVSSDKLEVVDIPVGYTHNIENLGETDMITIMWCNECFNPDKPDTFFEIV